MLGLRCSTGSSLVVESRAPVSLQCMGLSLQRLLSLQSADSRAHVPQYLWLVGSVVAAARLWSCGAEVSLLHSLWELSRSGIEYVSPALADGFFTTESLSLFLGFFHLEHIPVSSCCWTLICFCALGKSLPVLKEWLCGGDESYLSTLSLLLAVC